MRGVQQWYLISHLLLSINYTVGFNINFNLNQVLHHGAEYSGLFKRAYFKVTEELDEESESDEHYHQTLKSLPWNLNTTYSSSTRQTTFHNRNKNHNKRLPDIRDKATIISLARMSYDAYYRPDSKEDWVDLGKKYNLVEGFGWEEDGIRAYVFADPKEEFVVIALKGTSASLISNHHQTTKKDKFNDNLLFSCCCSSASSIWKNVCDCQIDEFTCRSGCVESSLSERKVDNYYYAAQVEDQFPNAQIWLTGHSLGGGLSSLLGLTFNLPTVTFESPGDLLPARRLQLPRANSVNMEDIPIWHFGHNADPIFTGECKGSDSLCHLGGYAIESRCHTGHVCPYDTKTHLNWSVNLLHHRIGTVIDQVITRWDHVPRCYVEVGCEDCGSWEYK